MWIYIFMRIVFAIAKFAQYKVELECEGELRITSVCVCVFYMKYM